MYKPINNPLKLKTRMGSLNRSEKLLGEKKLKYLHTVCVMPQRRIYDL